MAIIIKADMPTRCVTDKAYCPYYFDCKNQGSYFDEGRPSDCPILGEIPDVHGRLVDIDRIIEILEKNSDAGIPRTNAEVACLLKELAKYSTVVEASK